LMTSSILRSIFLENSSRISMAYPGQKIFGR
jgi:hypothetical protein